MTPRQFTNRGFTLIELMIGLLIAGVLIVLAAPSFREMMMNNRMTSAANEVAGAFAFARMEATKRGQEVYLGRQDGTSWTGGVVVWVDSITANGSWDAGEEIRVWPALDNESTLVSANSRTTFMFTSLGRVGNADTLSLCDSRTNETGRDITLLSSGAISVKRESC